MHYEERARIAARQYQLARFAPSACLQFRKENRMSQSQLARLLGVYASTISALENGKIRNWKTAECALILNGEDLELLKVDETEGLRERINRALEKNIPIHFELDDDAA